MTGDIECLILLFGVPAMLQLKPWSARGASHHPPIWATIIHILFSLTHPVDEFSFKEMSIMWGQPKILSSCLCVRCKSKELGGRESTRFPTSMVESFSVDFLPAIKSYWTEPHLEFCHTFVKIFFFTHTHHSRDSKGRGKVSI